MGMKFLRNKKIMILTIFLISLFAVGFASAADNSTSDVVSMDDTGNNVFNIEIPEGKQSFYKLNETINGHDDEDIYLSEDYVFYDNDSDFRNGIVIDRDVTIYGNGCTINGKNEARIFKVENNHNVVFNNINFVNAHAADAEYGGAVSGGYAVNCTFTNNSANFTLNN